MKTSEETLRVIKWNGDKITEPGIYSRIPLAMYHSQKICDGPSVSSSNLRIIFSKSPAHFYDTWSGNPDCEEQEETRALTLGRAAHHLTLGEAAFGKAYAMPPTEYPDAKTGELKAWNYNATYCKNWRDAAMRQGKAILSPDMGEKIIGMARSLGRHPIVKDGGLNGLIEHSVFWKDRTTGLWVKIRPDAIPTSGVDAVDLKSTATGVAYDDLVRTTFEFNYHQQGALILQGFREVLKLKNPTFTLIFVESKRPYCVGIKEIKENEIERGNRQNRFALDKIARCMATGEWPGPSDSIDAQYIEFYEWMQKKIDDKLQFER